MMLHAFGCMTASNTAKLGVLECVPVLARVSVSDSVQRNLSLSNFTAGFIGVRWCATFAPILL